MSWDDEKIARLALLEDGENAERATEYGRALKKAVYESCLKLVERRPLAAVEILRDLFAENWQDEGDAGCYDLPDSVFKLAEWLCVIDSGFRDWWEQAAQDDVPCAGPVLCGAACHEHRAA